LELKARRFAMRYLVGFVVLVALGISPLSASAQAGEEGATSEPTLQEPAPPSEPAPEEPALQLKLDDAGVEVVPSPPRTFDGYTLEEMELRVRRARIGVGVSVFAFLAGFGMGMPAAVELGLGCIAIFEPCTTPGWVAPVGITGAVLMAGGVAGMIASGILLRRRKRDRDRLLKAHYGRLHRVQWDLTRSRLVF
jgi:hypothetical protein